jgi:hypothetical protein
MKDFKKLLAIAFIVGFMFIAALSNAEEDYDPPFQITGIVKVVNEDSLEVYLPYINKKVTVLVSEDAQIINRIKTEDKSQTLSAIAAEDLIVIKGVLKGESFYGKKISYLPSSK